MYKHFVGFLLSNVSYKKIIHKFDISRDINFIIKLLGE